MTTTLPITHLLLEWGSGSRTAFEQLTPLVYDELRKLASTYLKRERPGHTLQPTALVHEAYLRLMAQDQPTELGEPRSLFRCGGSPDASHPGGLGPQSAGW
jgi:hypothetical protein